MDFIKRIYIASIVLSLAFFAACGDSDSSDITTPNNSSETDITDTASQDTATTVKDSSATGDSTAVNDSTATKDTTAAVKSSSSVEKPSSANSTSSSSTGNSSSSSGNNSSVSSSSSIIGNENAEGCIVSADTIYLRYPVTCNGVPLGNLYAEVGVTYPIAVDGQNCTLNDHLDSIVDVTCDTATYTLHKVNAYLGGGSYYGPELVSCKDTDLWCYSPIIDGADKSPTGQLTYREAEGFFFGSAGTHDLTDWEGICITYTSDVSADIILDLGETKNQELNNNLPQITLNSKTLLPADRCFSWNEFKQPRWTSPAIAGKEAAKAVASFKINKPSGSNFDLIRIRAYRNEDHSFDRTCGDMWCAEYAEETVITDCGNDPVGVWKSTTDATSSVIWPAKLGHEFNPISLLPVIDIYNSVAGTFNLGNGENPYAKVGFDMSYNSDQNFDITQWGGFCITYKSSHDFFAELTPSNATEGQKIPRVLVPRSLEYTTIDLPWSSFNPADASTVNFVNFVFSEPAGATGYFAFYTVGKPGTCTK